MRHAPHVAASEQAALATAQLAQLLGEAGDGVQPTAANASAKILPGPVPAPVSEPSREDLLRETQRMQEEELEAPAGKTRAKSSKKRAAPLLEKDLLTSYMEQLGALPLFRPEQELSHARELLQHEITTWRLLLQGPRVLEHVVTMLDGKAAQLDDEVTQKVRALDAAYRRAAARSHKKELADSPQRQEQIAELAGLLRRHDFDKELLDKLMEALRHEVWSRRVLTDKLAYRLTHAELTEIERSRGAALRIRNQFVRANLRLVVSVARNFRHYRVPFIDLIQEGNVGLMKAVHRFDHARGFRFSTYAHWWIRQSIERAIINKGSQVRLPVHIIDMRRQIGRATAKLQQQTGRPPTPQEVAAALGVPMEKLEQATAGIQHEPISLDDSVSGEDPRRFLDLVRDPEAAPLDEALIRENTHAKVRELLHLLGPIEKDIIRRRFGLGTDADQTLDEIGKIYNLSRERVRQIQAQSLSKMRRMCERRQIE